MIDLKPCYYCGGEMKVTAHRTAGRHAECLKCGALGPWKLESKEAAKAHNTCHEPAPEPITPKVLRELGFAPSMAYCDVWHLKNIHFTFWPTRPPSWEIGEEEIIPGPRTRAQLETLLKCLGLTPK